MPARQRDLRSARLGSEYIKQQKDLGQVILLHGSQDIAEIHSCVDFPQEHQPRI